jgi:WD40 repeat protein
LDVSVLQLYTSGIAFTPSNNLIARHYAPGFKHALPSIPRGISTTQSGPLVLKGHRDSVNCVTYSLDGTRLVSGSSDGSLILWDTETGAQISQLPSLGVSIGCLSYSPRGSFVIYGAEDGYIRKWDGIASDAMELGSLDTLEPISSLCWSPNGFEIMGGTANGSLWGFGMLFPSEVTDYGHVHSDVINSAAYSPTGTTIASASSDHTVKLWHVGTLENSAEPTFVLEHSSAVHCVAFSPTRPVLATGTDYFHVWKADTGQEIFRGILEGILRCLSYSPDGSQVITTHGSHIRQRETNTRSFTGSKFEGHTDDVTCVSYSPKGDFIVSGSQDRSLRLWNLCHANLDEGVGHKTTVTSLSFSQDGDSLASAASDGTFSCFYSLVTRHVCRGGWLGAQTVTGLAPCSSASGSSPSNKLVLLRAHPPQ